MSESVELFFKDDDARLYGKLHSASHDLGLAMAYGEFIIKKGWAAKPWSRGSIYLQQAALVTAMVASYGRAFTRSDGWPPLPVDLRQSFSEEEKLLHEDTIRLRHQVYAHSDAEQFTVRPWRSEHHSDIQMVPTLEFDTARLLVLIGMMGRLRAGISDRMAEIKKRY